MLHVDEVAPVLGIERHLCHADRVGDQVRPGSFPHLEVVILISSSIAP